MKKLFKSVLVTVALCMPLVGCSSGTITDEQGAKWAEENGYVKVDSSSGATASSSPDAETDTTTSATEKQQGGVNYGAIEWDEPLQEAAIKEFLKGGKYIGDASLYQDDTGYNYREMYQMATVRNGKPVNTNLEMVLDASDLHLLGVSEAGTGKTQDFEKDPNVSISWVRQLHEEDEETYNYYCSYGVQYDGTVKIYTASDLETEEGQDALINLFDKYYPTLASTWAGYGASFADKTDADEIRTAKLEYITNTVSKGASVYYEIIPTKIVITAPFLMNLSPTMANAATFTTEMTGASSRYNYSLGLTDAFIDKLVDYKAAFIADDTGKEEVTAYYSTGMFPTLDEYCKSMSVPTSLEYALDPTNAAGLKTQTTYLP